MHLLNIRDENQCAWLYLFRLHYASLCLIELITFDHTQKLVWMHMNTCESRRHSLKYHKIHMLKSIDQSWFHLEWHKDPFKQLVFQASYMLCWQFLFRDMKAQSIACLQSETTHIYWILDPWRWSALNMDFMDKQPSRMQGQYFFSFSFFL